MQELHHVDAGQHQSTREVTYALVASAASSTPRSSVWPTTSISPSREKSKVGNGGTEGEKEGSVFSLLRSRWRAWSTTRDLPKLFREGALVPKGLVTAYTNKVCEAAVAAAKKCKQKLKSMSGADTVDTIWYVLLGVPRNLVSVDGEHGVDLAAIYERLSESGLGSCLMRR